MGLQLSGEDGCRLGRCDPKGTQPGEYFGTEASTGGSSSWLPESLALSSAFCLYVSAEVMVITMKDGLPGLRGSSSRLLYMPSQLMVPWVEAV